MSNTQLAHNAAATKAAAANARADSAKQDRHRLHEAIERLARKYAYLKIRKGTDLLGSSGYSDEPRTATKRYPGRRV